MTEKNGYHVHVEGGSGSGWPDLRQVWEYRDLVLLFAKRRFTVSYKQMVLGPVWIFLGPLVTGLVFSVIFGNMIGLSTGGVPRILFYMTGSSIWSYFSECVTGCSRSFTDNSQIFGKVYFPRLCMPLSNVLYALAKLLIQLISVIGLTVFFAIRGEVSPLWHLWPLLAVIVPAAGLMGMGIGLIISSLSTRYRDLMYMVGFGLSVWMYLTPVIYPLSQFTSPLIKKLLKINPMTFPMEAIRKILLGSGAPDGLTAAVFAVFLAAVLLTGVRAYTAAERTFIDNV